MFYTTGDSLFKLNELYTYCHTLMGFPLCKLTAFVGISVKVMAI